MTPYPAAVTDYPCCCVCHWSCRFIKDSHSLLSFIREVIELFGANPNPEPFTPLWCPSSPFPTTTDCVCARVCVHESLTIKEWCMASRSAARCFRRLSCVTHTPAGCARTWQGSVLVKMGRLLDGHGTFFGQPIGWFDDSHVMGLPVAP